MLRRIVKKLTNNLGLKILALIFAMVMWLVVLNIDDPVKTKSITLSVTTENGNYITSQGKYYEVLDGNNTISFYFSAKRSITEKMSASDFTATADLKKIEYVEKDDVYRVPVSIVANKNAGDVSIATRQLYIDIALEDSASKQFSVKANTTGTVADGYALGNVEINNTNIVKISGPASVVNTIDTATATVNVEGMSTDITDNVVPVLYDVEGNVVDTTKLNMNINAVTITAQILSTKDVSLEFLTTGTPAEGYQMASVTSSPNTVRIKGEASVLNTIDKITIPAEVLDLTDAAENIEKQVDITSYMQNGVSLVLSSDAKVDVTVEIEEIKSRALQIPVSNLTIEGLDESYRLRFLEDYMEVTVTGGTAEVDALDEAAVTGTLDVTDMGTGNHTTTVIVDLDEEMFTLSSTSVAFEIMRNDAVTE